MPRDSLFPLRQDYKAAVMAPRPWIETPRREGRTDEEIARLADAERRRLAGLFKARTPEPLRTRITERTLAAYGDPLGPTIEELRARGKNWREIADGAARHGRLPVEDPAS